MVLQFLYGVQKFSGYPSEMLLNMLCVNEYVVSGDDWTSDEESDNDSYVVRKVIVDSLHWLFEAHDTKVIATVRGHLKFSLIDNMVECLLLTAFVLGYCVSHSNCTWNIDLFNCHIGDEGVEMIV